MINRSEELEELALRLGLAEADLPALEQALTHKSLVAEEPLLCNERLEFLGDAVLGLVVNELLFHSFPEKMEGELARAKALIVCQASLAAAARRLGIIPLLRIGRSEEAMGGRNRASLAGDVFEAIVAVIYQSRGYAAARDFVTSQLAPEIGRVHSLADWRDPKTILQELRQGRRLAPPVYRVVQQEGLPHNRVFTISVELDGHPIGQGVGKTKREAEQAAAQATLDAVQSRRTLAQAK